MVGTSNLGSWNGHWYKIGIWTEGVSMGQCYWLNSRLDWSDWTHWSTDWKDWPVELDWSVAWLVDWSKWLVEYMINRMVSWLNYLWSTRVPEWETSLVHLLACFVQSQRVLWSIRQWRKGGLVSQAKLAGYGLGHLHITSWTQHARLAYPYIYVYVYMYVYIYIYTNMLPLSIYLSIYLYIYIYTNNLIIYSNNTSYALYIKLLAFFAASRASHWQCFPALPGAGSPNLLVVQLKAGPLGKVVHFVLRKWRSWGDFHRNFHRNFREFDGWEKKKIPGLVNIQKTMENHHV